VRVEHRNLPGKLRFLLAQNPEISVIPSPQVISFRSIAPKFSFFISRSEQSKTYPASDTVKAAPENPDSKKLGVHLLYLKLTTKMMGMYIEDCFCCHLK